MSRRSFSEVHQLSLQGILLIQQLVPLMHEPSILFLLISNNSILILLRSLHLLHRSEVSIDQLLVCMLIEGLRNV